MKYKLVACDFDGTLYSAETLKISDYTKEIIKRYERAGGTFVICSGRMYRSIAEETKKLGLHGVAISYQGALAKNVDTGETLHLVEMKPDLAVEYLNFIDNYPAVAQLYVDDELYVKEKNKYTDNYAAYCNVTPNIVGDLTAFIGGNTKPINKIYCHVPSELCAEIREAAAKRFEGRLMISSSGRWNVEAVDISASKGKAVQALAKLKGIDISEVMTFGDNLNDLDMIVAAGCGVAVGNAVDELKAKADYVSESCVDDGVAKTIEKFCL